jgi:tungstate transport system ATP-binding protein
MHTQRQLVMRSVSLVRGGARRLHAVDLCLALGSRSVLLGPNGSGKTSLLQLIHGLLVPESGLIRVEPANHDAPDRDGTPDFAFVFQRPVMLKRTVIGNVEHALAIGGVDRLRRRRLAYSALECVGIAALAERPARRLSGGEQQRVAIARADALSPRYLLLDEPCASLDPASTLAIERYLLERAKAGRGFLMSTHDLGQARRLAEWVVFVRDGRILECTPADQFFSTPVSEPARRFMSGELAL